MDIAELKEESRSWNLASDSKLLEYLQQFSAGVTDRTKSFVEKVDNLSFEVAESEVSLKNTFNEFLMLGNSQFIENRVYDDDDDDEDLVADSKYSDGPTFVDPVTNLKEAFTLGQAALKLFFFEDNQDDKFEDIYNVRPLPYIIGTKSYVDSADAGLGGMVGFEEEPVNTAAAPSGGESYDNDDESFEAPRAVRARSTSSDGQAHSAPPRPPPRATTNYDYDDDDEDVVETFVNDDSTVASGSASLPPPKPTGNPLKDMLNAQINNRSGGAPAPVSKANNNWDEDDEDSTDGAPQKPISAAVSKGAAPVKAPTRRASDEFSVASGSQQGGQGGRAASVKDVEEDEDDEGDLFADNDDPFKLFGSKPSTFNRKSNTRNSLGDLFGTSDLGDDDNDSLFGGGGSTAKAGVPKRKASFSSLFGDANDESLFDEVAALKKPEPSVSPVPAAKSTPKYDAHDLFGSDDTEKPSTTATTDTVAATTEEKPAETKKAGLRGMGASDLFGGGGLFGDDEEDGGLFGSKTVSSTKTTASSSITPKSGATSKAKFASLFGDDDDSASLFGSSSLTAKPSAGASAATAATKKKSIFDDDDEDEDGGLFGTSQTKSTPAPVVEAAPVVVAPEPTHAPAVVAPQVVEEEDEEEDPFGVAAKPTPVVVVATAPAPIAAPAPVTKPVVKKSIFDDDDDEEDDLFAPKAASRPASVVASKPASASAVAPAKKKSIFDDDSGDDDDLFGVKPKAAPVVVAAVAAVVAPVPVAGKKKSVFDDDSGDDADLFGSKPAASVKPVVSSPEPVPVRAVEEPVPTTTTFVDPLPIPLPPPRRAPVQESDDDDEEEEDDDLFGSAKKTTPAAAPVVVEEVVEAEAVTPAAPAPHVGVRMGVALPMPFNRPPIQETDSEDEDLPPKQAPISVPIPVIVPVPTPFTIAPVVAPQEEDAPAAPLVASSPAVTNKRISGNLASILGGMDASKIIMPGMAPPPRFSKPEEPVEVPATSGADSNESEVKAADAPVEAALSRATTKQKRAPTKKTFKTEETPVASAPASTPVAAEAPVVPAPVAATAPVSASKKDLFGDDDGDLFGAKPTPKTEPVPVAAQVSVVKKSIFDDDNDDDSDLFGTKKVTPVVAPAPVVVHAEVPAIAPVPISAAKQSLFGDDEDETTTTGPITQSPAPAAVPTPVPEPKPVVADPLGSHFDVGADSPTPTSHPSVAAPAVSSASKSSSLFGDDDGGLFGNSKSSASKAVPAPAVRRSSKPTAKGGLFGDDDDGLFGDDNSTLFGTSGTKKPISTTASTSAAKKSSLFGDSDDDDFFGTKKTASKPKSKSVFDD